MGCREGSSRDVDQDPPSPAAVFLSSSYLVPSFVCHIANWHGRRKDPAGRFYQTYLFSSQRSLLWSCGAAFFFF